MRWQDISTGAEPAWAFLIRTPEAVEAGIRELLKARLSPDFQVEKKGLTLTPSPKTLNPDLVFDNGYAVGDVKYKIQGPDWDNPDLYQVVAFATGYSSKKAAIGSFSTGRMTHQPLRVGDVTVSNLSWPAGPTLAPHVAATTLAASVRSWLETDGR
jgi:5-methylcytosine-specific restriction enzyme subunit McrC